MKWIGGNRLGCHPVVRDRIFDKEIAAKRTGLSLSPEF